MTDTIRAVLRSRGSPHYLRLLRWCREQRIPIVICEVGVGATCEPTAYTMTGSKVEFARWDTIVKARRLRNRQGFSIWDSDLAGDSIYNRGILIRESDYDLVMLYHGGMMERSWRYYIAKAMGY